MKYGYKVCRVVDDKFYSLIFYEDKYKDIRLEYRLDEKTVGINNTPVMIFEELDNAMRYMHQENKVLLFGQCSDESYPLYAVRKVFDNKSLLTPKKILNFWDRIVEGKRFKSLNYYSLCDNAPRGTIAAYDFVPTDIIAFSSLEGIKWQ